MGTPLKVIATSLAIAGLSAAITVPAFAASRDLHTLAVFTSKFSTDAHRFEIAMNGKPVEITHSGTTTYLAPNGDREITRFTAEGGTVMTVCKAPNARGLMDCFVSEGDLWTKASLLEPPSKGWLGTVGAYLSDLQAIQVGVLKGVDAQGGSWTVARGHTTGLTRYSVRATDSPTMQNRELTATFTPRGFKLVERATGYSPPVMSTIRVVKLRPVTFPADIDATPGWG